MRRVKVALLTVRVLASLAGLAQVLHLAQLGCCRPHAAGVDVVPRVPAANTVVLHGRNSIALHAKVASKLMCTWCTTFQVIVLVTHQESSSACWNGSPGPSCWLYQLPLLVSVAALPCGSSSSLSLPALA